MSSLGAHRPDPERPAPRWAPTPLPELHAPQTPTEHHFVRDHFPVPVLEGPWSCAVIGSACSLVLDLDAVRELPPRTLLVLLECSGHRRVEFATPHAGIPWGVGAVSQARWTGVSLAALLQRVGIPADAREVVLEGADAGQVPGVAGTHRFARSLPLEKALDPDVLLATEINGEPISARRGGPVRAIVPGWYATDSVKWLDRIWFTTEFGGYFQATDYRLQTPGEPGPGTRMTTVPIHALITTPGEQPIAAGEQTVGGVAWGGEGGVAEVYVRVDLGPWTRADLAPAPGPYAAVPWELTTTLARGRHEIACQAIDAAGNAQPLAPVENVRGYANHAVHRVRVTAR